jgi:DNA-binding transcriptional LysR family regulator
MYSTGDLQLFIRTAETSNLSQAARHLNLSTATASASLKRLEEKLATRLFVRSTRSMRLSPDGEIFLDYARAALAQLSEGEALIGANKLALRGTIRVAVSSDLGRNLLLPWLNEFQDIHPAVHIAIEVSDSNIDLFRDPVDLALRYGKQADSSLISQHLIHVRRILVAAPDYLGRHPPLSHPRDLAQHNCLLYYLKHGLANTWTFANGVTIKVSGDRSANDGAIVKEWAIAGFGICYKSEPEVRQDIESGRLVRVLPDVEGDDIPLSAVYAHRSMALPRLRILLSFLREKLSATAGKASI